MPSYHFILCRPLLLQPSIFPSIRVFSNESALCIRWSKYWSFSFSISPSNEYSGLISFKGFPGAPSGKEPACQCRRLKRHKFDLWVRQSPGEGNGNPLQYSCLENPMDRGTWQATVHGIAKSQTWLKQLSMISFRIDWFDLAVQGTLKSLLTVQSINSSMLSLLYGPTLTSIHDYWENHSFDQMDLCQQNNVSAF